MNRRSLNTTAMVLIPVLLAAACSERSAPSRDGTGTASTAPRADGQCENHAPQRMPLFGDLHVHTNFSFDAAANSTGATPEDAHRFARGEAIPFFPLDETGQPIGSVTIDRPLDFLAVTDHGEFLGERALCRTSGSPAFDSTFCVNYRANERQGMMMLGTVITTETPARIPALCGDDGSLCTEFARSPWQEIQRAANAANSPCEFTSFVAYEYTGTPGTSNYHRNVIFAGSQVPALPVSYIDAPIDSKLWAALDAVCEAEHGCDYLTIPHNSNLANGRMAPYRQLDGSLQARRGYARKRLQREPIMEIFQHKGGSECINGLTSVLSAPDELCNVEAVRRIGATETYAVTTQRPDGSVEISQASEVTRECAPGEHGSNGMLGAGCVDATDFQRSALVVGMAEEREIGLNPIKLGVIASTDTHTATAGDTREDAWGGAVTGEATPAQRLKPGLLTSGIDGNPGGLAGVWATENTRSAIFAAMRRREVFGTSGPRITPRLFAGFDLPADACEQPDMVARAYATGVPMGADLTTSGSDRAPRILAWAARDPEGEPLVALQLIKGRVATDGSLHTEVIDLVSDDDGAASLCAVYTDTGFDPDESTYWYLRALQPPTPRWHTYDCARLPEGERPAVCSDGSYPDTVVEMAWTSPIWYRAAAVQ